MPKHADPQEDSSPRVAEDAASPRTRWRVTSVTPLANHRIQVRFVDGLEGIEPD